MVKEDQDPFAGIKQQLKHLVAERSFSDAELIQIIDAVVDITDISDLPQPTLLQSLLLKLRLITEDDLWQLPYQRKMAKLKLRLNPRQLEALPQVIIQGVLGDR